MTAMRLLNNALPHVSVDIVDTLSSNDLHDLAEATEATINGGGGFGWVTSPGIDTLERYWKGVLAVPERHLLISRVDGAVCGATQLVEPTRHNEAQAFSATLIATFVAPHVRRMGCGQMLVATAEKLAIAMGYQVLHLDIRETQRGAITLFEASGFTCWGKNPFYAQVNGTMITGLHYSKILTALSSQA
ncbi:MAG: GNAT family N-acetyltransferase [Alphaproteobacteria bacterium]|nr:GNAT family N-acetyltransferase [Alphaproteobacteria bacterium]